MLTKYFVMVLRVSIVQTASQKFACYEGLYTNGIKLKNEYR